MEMFFTIAMLGIAAIYGTFVLLVSIRWKSIPVFKSTSNEQANVEIIVPCKNKASYVSECITSILDADDGSLRITFVDDGSLDDSLSIAKKALRSTDQIITLKESLGKKKALDQAIRKSDRELICTTDADCVVSTQCIKILKAALLQEQADLILGPVFIKKPKRLIEWFQQFDLLATMATTQVGHHLSWFYSGSGAHMGYAQKSYQKLNPYEDNQHIASGDDIFFIDKVIASGGSTYFIKHPSSYVLTEPEDSWSTLFRQRIRWAGKTKYYQHNGLKFLWLAVGIILLCYCLSLVLIVFQAIWMAVLIAWSVKCAVDFVLVNQMAKFYDFKIAFLPFLISLMIYPFFTVAVAMTSFFARVDRW
jgi:glycosyltransferase involved in cell wall biosynthesis